MADADTLHLPGVLGDMQRVVGVRAAMRVCMTWGGDGLYIPREPDDDHPLTKALGKKVALLLGKTFGGRGYEIPNARSHLMHFRARRMRRAGKSIRKIVRATGMSRRQVSALVHDIPVQGADEDDAPAPVECPLCGHRHKRGKHQPRQQSGDDRQLALPLA